MTEHQHEFWLYIAQNKTLKDFEVTNEPDSYFYARIGCKDKSKWKDIHLYDQLSDLITIKSLTKILDYGRV